MLCIYNVCVCVYLWCDNQDCCSREMAARGGSGMAQRPNGIPREKVCQFKLVLLGECVSEWMSELVSE